jgi:hypothetical protein
MPLVSSKHATIGSKITPHRDQGIEMIPLNAA